MAYDVNEGGKTIKTPGNEEYNNDVANPQKTIRATDSGQKTIRLSGNENTEKSSCQENTSGNNDQSISMDDLLGLMDKQLRDNNLLDIFSESHHKKTSSKIALNLKTKVNLTLEEVANGVTRTIRYKRNRVCHRCDGTGVPEGVMSIPCSTCGGKGFIWEEQGLGGTRSTIFGDVTVNPHPVKKECPDCKGRGVLNVDSCPLCDGEGYITEEDTVTFDIPAGLLNGQGLVIKGKGNIVGDQTGDFLVNIDRILEHPVFQRNEYDLIYRVRIDAQMQMHGGTIYVPLLDGTKLPVVLPAHAGKQVVLTGYGLPIYGSGKRGNMIIELS